MVLSFSLGSYLKLRKIKLEKIPIPAEATRYNLPVTTYWLYNEIF